MGEVAQHTPMMQRGMFRVKKLSFFTNVSQCVSQVRSAMPDRLTEENRCSNQ